MYSSREEGHVMDMDGIHNEPEKVQRIGDWLSPMDLHQLRFFIGLTSFYNHATSMSTLMIPFKDSNN